MAIWEFAPGSPWNATFTAFCHGFPGALYQPLSFCQYPAGGFEVGRRIDAARHRVHDTDVDPHAGLERPQLLELLLLFQRRGGSDTKRSSAARR